MFRSPEQALGFAFRIRDRSVISLPSGINLANKSEPGSNGDRLSQYDLHAQAGMVFSFLSRRPQVEQAYAFYLYGNDRERRLSAAFLAAYLRERLSRYEMNGTKLRRAIQAQTIRQVSDRTGLTQYKAWKFRQDLADELLPVRQRLMDALWQWLTQDVGDLASVE